MTSPFDLLGLAASSDLTDDDVRAAWRRLAAATHPDRPDGGDPEAFAATAAAYTLLRTAAGRGEALADLLQPGGADGTWRSDIRRPVTRRNSVVSAAGTIAWRISRGRPARLAARLLATVAAAVLAVTGVGWQPASAAVIAGALTWLALTIRHDLAPRP